ncbi:hypothetical protein DRJ17_01100 [Candidatus Woesearchaeota archaeon]|nr:MAG: hypothetical protein DRJ17_01100 [Candidatus Woesearchaeota archaeon]
MKTNSKSVHKQILEWEKDLKIKKEIVKDMISALTFSSKSKINKRDLVIVLRAIKNSRKKIIEMKNLQNRFNYNRKDFCSIIIRLKKLGEIYDPYLTEEKEGIFISVI